MEPATPQEGGTAPAMSPESTSTPTPAQHTPAVTCPVSVTKHLQSLKKLTLDCSDMELRSYVTRAIVATPLSPHLNPRNAAVSRAPPLDIAEPEPASPATSEGMPSFTARSSTPLSPLSPPLNHTNASVSPATTAPAPTSPRPIVDSPASPLSGVRRPSLDRSHSADAPSTTTPSIAADGSPRSRPSPPPPPPAAGRRHSTLGAVADGAGGVRRRSQTASGGLYAQDIADSQRHRRRVSIATGAFTGGSPGMTVHKSEVGTMSMDGSPHREGFSTRSGSTLRIGSDLANTPPIGSDRTVKQRDLLAITDIKVLYGQSQEPPPGYSKIDTAQGSASTSRKNIKADLNMGAGGSYVFLCVRHTRHGGDSSTPSIVEALDAASRDEPPVVALAVVHDGVVPYGFEVVTSVQGERANLNGPSNSQKTWLCMRRSFGHRAITDIAVLISKKGPNVNPPTGFQILKRTPGRPGGQPQTNEQDADLNFTQSTSTKIFLAFQLKLTALDPVQFCDNRQSQNDSGRDGGRTPRAEARSEATVLVRANTLQSSPHRKIGDADDDESSWIPRSHSADDIRDDSAGDSARSTPSADAAQSECDAVSVGLGNDADNTNTKVLLTTGSCESGASPTTTQQDSLEPARMAEARRVAVEARDLMDESMHAGRSPRFSTGSLVEVGESPDTDNVGSNSSSGFSSASEDEGSRRPSKDSDAGYMFPRERYDSADSTDISPAFGSNAGPTSPSQQQEHQERTRRDSLRGIAAANFSLVTAGGSKPPTSRRAVLLPLLRGCYGTDEKIVCTCISGLKSCLDEGWFDDDFSAQLAISEFGINEQRTLAIVAVQAACDALDNCHSFVAKPLLTFLNCVIMRCQHGLHPVTLHQILTACLAMEQYEPSDVISTLEALFKQIAVLVERHRRAGSTNNTDDDVGDEYTIVKSVLGRVVDKVCSDCLANSEQQLWTDSEQQLWTATDEAMVEAKKYHSIHSSPSFCYDIFKYAGKVFDYQPQKNMFQLIATLSKAAMMPLPVHDAVTAAAKGGKLGVAVNRKVVILRTLNVMLKAICHGSISCVCGKMGYQVRRWVVTAVLFNFNASHIPLVFQELLAIISTLWRNYRAHVKIELAVIAKNILIDGILRSENALPKQKQHVLEALADWCASPSDLVELFQNFDMDLIGGLQYQVFHLLCGAICDIAVEQGVTMQSSATGSRRYDDEGEETGTQMQDLRITALESARRITGALQDASCHIHLVKQEAQRAESSEDEDGDDEAVAHIDTAVDGDASNSTMDDALSSRHRSRLRGLSVGWDFDSVSSPSGMVSAAADRALDAVALGAGSDSAKSGSTDRTASTTRVPITRQSSFRKRHKQQKSIGGQVKEALALSEKKTLRKAIQLLVDRGVLENEALPICNFIRNYSQHIEDDKVGDYLAEGDDELKVAVRQTFVGAMQFRNLGFVPALRQFLTKGGFRLPGEAQKIERMLQTFAECYWNENQDSFSHSDTAFILAYSTIMLNTDLHNPNVKKDKKMKKSDFERNNGKIDNGKDLPKELIEGIFDEIQQNEIAWQAEPMLAKQEAAQADPVQKRQRMQKAMSRAGHETIELTRSFAQQRYRPDFHFVGHGEHGLKLSPEIIRLLVEQTEQLFYDVALSVIEKFTNELEMVQGCLEVLQRCIASALYTKMHVARRKFSQELFKAKKKIESYGETGGKHVEPHAKWFETVLGKKEDVDIDALFRELFDIVRELCEQLEQQSGRAAMQSIAGRISRSANLNVGERSFLKEGMLTKKCRKKNEKYNFFLFSDQLMYCHQSALGKRWLPHKQFLLRSHCVSVEAVETGLLSRVTGGEKHGFVINNTLKNITVYADSERDKNDWMRAIRGAVEQEFARWKEKNNAHERSTMQSMQEPACADEELGAEDTAIAEEAAGVADSPTRSAESTAVVPTLDSGMVSSSTPTSSGLTDKAKDQATNPPTPSAELPMKRSPSNEEMPFLQRFQLGLSFVQKIMDGSAKDPALQCTSADKLLLYGLFKQALFGDCMQSKPDIGGPAQLVAEAKWKAHCDHRGLRKAQAMKRFVSELDQLFPQWQQVQQVQQQQQQQQEQQQQQQL